jgi:hypothetical protein
VVDERSGTAWRFPIEGASGVHRLSAIVDRNGNQISFVRDAAGIPVEVVHSGGYRIQVHSALIDQSEASRVVKAVVGPEPFRLEAPSDAFGHRNEATRTWLRQIAIHHLHVPDPVAPELTVRLERGIESGQRDGIIEGNLFAHLFALLSLHRVAPGHRLIGEGIAHLAKLVRPDGAIPFIRSEEIFATATAGLALSQVGIDRRVLLPTMGDYLARLGIRHWTAAGPTPRTWRRQTSTAPPTP